MAKKKQTHQQKSAEMAETQENYQTTPDTAADGSTADDMAEKLSNLKSLNKLLVNETAKKRQEIGELLDDKKSLEAELTRSESERESVLAELTRVREELVKVEEEKVELKREMEKVVKERDEMERMKCEGDLEIVKLNELSDELRSEIERGIERFDVAIREKEEFESEVMVKNKEVMELREKLSDMEVKERSLMGEFVGLKERYENVANAVRESEEKVEGMKVECEGLLKEVEGLMGENEVVSRENEVLRKGKLENEGRISELSEEVCGLNGVVESLREDEEKWRVKFFKLEKRNAEVLEEFVALKSEFGALLEEKKTKEREIEGLVGEKSENLKRLGVLEVEIESVKRVNEEVLEEKRRLEEVNLRQCDEIKELHSVVGQIRVDLLSLQESNKDQLSENMKLLSEVNEYKSALDRAVNERDDVKRCLDEMKMYVAKLQVKVSELSTQMKENAKVIEELTGTTESVIAEKNELEIRYNKLAEEKGLIEKNHVKAKEKVTELEGNLRSKSDMFNSALVMLRNTTTKKGEDEGISVNGEMGAYMAEIEAIRAVLRSKEEKVGEMEKHIERLHCCVLDAKKKKSFWTIVSSATTILAAVVSFAYATRVR